MRAMPPQAGRHAPTDSTETPVSKPLMRAMPRAAGDLVFQVILDYTFQSP